MKKTRTQETKVTKKLLNDEEFRFVIAYSGDARAACEKAGIDPRKASIFLRRSHVKTEISKKQKLLDRVAAREEADV